MKYNFSEIKLAQIDGTPIESHEIHKELANSIYMYYKELDFVTIAMEIFKGNEVELTKIQIEDLKKFIGTDQLGLAAFAKKALIDYLGE